MQRTFTTGWKRERPRRPYKNFGLFLLIHCCTPDNRYPCLHCGGHGQIDDPNDPPDPVEGYRNVRRIRCPECKGTGRSTEEACQEAYRTVIEAWEEERDDYDRLAAARKAALARLTNEEVRALRELGI